MNVEAKIIIFLQSNATPGWITFFMFATALASVAGLVLFAGIILIKDKRLSLVYAITFGGVALFNLIIKNIVRRPRPFDTFSDILNLGQESGFSMPSSHSALAGMTAVFMCYFAFKYSKSWWVRSLTIVVMVLFVLLIALSRMVLGVHYISDTAVGIAEGVAIGVVGIKINSVLEKKKIAH